MGALRLSMVKNVWTTQSPSGPDSGASEAHRAQPDLGDLQAAQLDVPHFALSGSWCCRPPSPLSLAGPIVFGRGRRPVGSCGGW